MEHLGAGGIRVLHVDDERDFGELTAEFLERETQDLSVTIATSAREALARLQKEQFDCVVSDYQMPEMDGLDFLETLRSERGDDVPFIVFTGKGREEVAMEALNRGADRYLQKGGAPRSQFGVLAQAIHQEVEHYRTQRELERSADIYRDIFDRSGLGLLVFEPATGQLLDSNDAAANLFGYSRSELLAIGVEAFTQDEPPYTREQAREHLDRAVEAGPQQFVWKAIRKDETPMWGSVVLKAATIRGEDRVIAVVRDITEQRERERQTELFRTLIDNATDSLFVVDEETGDFIDANETASELLGYDREELLEMCVPDISASFEDRAAYREFVQSTEGTTDGPTTDEHIRADGSTFPVEVNGSVVEVEGQTYRIAIARDVSKRTEREQVLTDLHEAATTIEAADDEDEVYERLVDAAETILEFDLVAVDIAEGDKLVQKAFSRDVGTEGYYEAVSLEEETFATRAYRRQETIVVDDLREADITPADPDYLSALTVPIGEFGTFQTVKSDLNGFDDTDRELAELLVGHARETLERLEGKRRLRARTRELERQNDRLEDFASIVSHDLRNPLNIATGRLETMRSECESENLEAVMDSLTRMESLIEDTLAMARGSQTVTEYEPVDAVSSLNRCWKAVDSPAADLEVSESFRVKADEDRFQQILENLIRNAIEHGGQGITVRAGALDGDGFYVEDDGPGIPQSERDVIFERGYTNSDDGTGFGLAIVDDIVEAHGWDISVTESEQGGARFEITGVEMV